MSCIPKMNINLIENLEDLDIIMLIMLEYSRNYSMKSWNLWIYYRNEIHEADVDYNVSDRKSFEYKTKLVGETSKRSSQSGTSGDADQPVQQQAP